MSLIQELKRRNVIRVAIGYVVLAWLMAQVAELLLETFGAPDWVMKTLFALFIIGLPFVVYFAWAFEITPEGVKREREVDRERSITPHTGRKLDRTIIVLLSVALMWFAWDRFSTPNATPDGTEAPGAVSTPRHPVPSTAASLPVVAVLPFKATGSDDGGFLAAGLHDDLLTRLAKLGAYRVISRTSVMEYADTTRNMREIGEELGAGYILEGGVQAMPGRVRINAQLIIAASDEHLWAEAYDHELSPQNLFDVQAELAQAIAGALHTELSPTDQALVDEVPTRNMAAYNAYLRGLQLNQRSGYVGTPRDHEAVVAFEEAVKLDPGFAEAWARLATARIKAATNFGYDAESSEAVLAALGRARSLKPGLLESELAWAEYQYRFLNEYEDGLATLEALGPRAMSNVEALQLMAYLNRRLGRYEEAYGRLQDARELAPRDPSVFLDLTLHAYQNDDCKAARNYAITLSSLAPDWTSTRIRLAEFELNCTGDTARAVEIYKGIDISEIGWWLYAYWAALHERDVEYALALIEWDSATPAPWDDLFDELGIAQVNRYLLDDQESVNRALDRAELLLGELESSPEFKTNSEVAWATALYFSLRGDASGTHEWVDEAMRRFEAESKGDVAEAAKHRLSYAMAFSQAGLYDAAVEQLRIMLEEPGGYRFPLIDGLPMFEPLQDHPGFVALRERFGEQADRSPD